MMPMQFPAAPSLWVSDVAADRVAGKPLGGSSAPPLASLGPLFPSHPVGRGEPALFAVSSDRVVSW